MSVCMYNKSAKNNLRLVAKKISLSGCQPMEVVNKMQEIFILMSLDHANILKYYDRFEDRSNQLLFIVTDYCEVNIKDIKDHNIKKFN